MKRSQKEDIFKKESDLEIRNINTFDIEEEFTFDMYGMTTQFFEDG